MIAVTGANGQLGQLVIKNLLEKTAATNIVALVRDPQKATALAELGVTVRQADYNQPASLVPALQGVTKLLLISGSEIGKRLPQHQAVIDAAKAQGVSLLAYTSLLKADVNPMLLAAEHKATEQAIREAGIPAVILRNGWYTENYTDSVQHNIASGIVMGTAAEGKLHTASRQDYAEAAVAVLLADQPQAGEVYELAGDHGFTLAEFAATVSRLAGKTVHFNNISQAEYTDVLCQIGLPNGLAAILADSEAQAAKGFLADDSQTLSKLIGRPTTTLEQSLASIL
ncbi:MAG: NAD(P)-dependent oxidoreductase [Gammaproteobacteria bacterium HGW-Gammaproteobacteria-15]|nr:MAG: NAD(P)-dependent oxidoreductase [Gammaproteobacteria bacterium HGW-Gammaproteobacteria-15]